MARLLFAAMLVFGVAGCDESPYAYPDRPEKNLLVLAVSNSGKVSLEVHNCRGAYEGFVPLDQPAVAIGMPTDRPSVLVFDFRNPNMSNKKEVQLAPRPGYRYEARVTFKDAIYTIELWEIDPRSNARRELDMSKRC